MQSLQGRLQGAGAQRQVLKPQPVQLSRPSASRRSPASYIAHAATAVEPAPAVSAQDKLDDQVAVVLGTQWGDEGKGKLVDILAQQYEIVARAQVRAGLAASLTSLLLKPRALALGSSDTLQQAVDQRIG